METGTFRIIAAHNNPIPDDWRKQLIELLGSKPRRLSRFCELGMYGALRCIQKNDQLESTQPLPNHPSPKMSLPSQIALRIYSAYGTIAATRSALDQAKDHLPMPFTFIQTQPGQLFNALGSALDWHGDGYSTAYNNLRIGEAMLLHGIRQSTLLAWVDETPELTSRWIWLDRAENISGLDAELVWDWCAIDSIFNTATNACWLKIAGDNQVYAAL